MIVGCRLQLNEKFIKVLKSGETGNISNSSLYPICGYENWSPDAHLQYLQHYMLQFGNNFRFLHILQTKVSKNETKWREMKINNVYWDSLEVNMKIYSANSDCSTPCYYGDQLTQLWKFSTDARQCFICRGTKMFRGFIYSQHNFTWVKIPIQIQYYQKLWSLSYWQSL